MVAGPCRVARAPVLPRFLGIADACREKPLQLQRQSPLVSLLCFLLSQLSARALRVHARAKELSSTFANEVEQHVSLASSIGHREREELSCDLSAASPSLRSSLPYRYHTRQTIDYFWAVPVGHFWDTSCAKTRRSPSIGEQWSAAKSLILLLSVAAVFASVRKENNCYFA